MDLAPRDIIAYVFLFLGVAVLLVSCIGLVRVQDTFDRLHMLGPASTITPAALLIYVLIEYGFAPAGIKMIVLTAALVIFGPVITHTTARAARIREFGKWVVLPDEKVDTG